MSEALFGIIGTIVGTMLGFGLSEWATRRREARQQAEEDAEFKLFTALSEAAKDGKVIFPDLGSNEHKMAESLVRKGMLQRLPGGAYGIPGQSFVIATTR